MSRFLLDTDTLSLLPTGRSSRNQRLPRRDAKRRHEEGIDACAAQEPVADQAEAAEQLAEDMLTANIKKGWDRVGA